MIAAAAPDVDGLGRIVSIDAYWKYHHVLGHNLLFCAVVAAAFAAFSTHRFKAGILYMALGHLHLLMDYFGSGPGWGIAYLWPFSSRQFKTHLAWEFFSWQNLTVAAILLLWTLLIALRLGRTPIETITPDLDKRLTARLRRNAENPAEAAQFRPTAEQAE